MLTKSHFMLPAFTASILFMACIFDTAKEGPNDGQPRITVDTLILSVGKTLLDSGETVEVAPTSQGDSLAGHLFLRIRHLADSQLVIVTTRSLGGVDSVDSAYFNRRDTIRVVDTLDAVRIPAIRVSDTVKTTEVLTDTSVFLAPDSGLAFDRTHRKTTSIATTYTGTTKVGDSSQTTRYFLENVTTRDSASVDSLRFFRLDSVITGKSDSIVVESVLRETRFRKGKEHTVVRDLEKIVTSRKVTQYHFRYISSKWSPDVDGSWVEVADTLSGMFAALESESKATRVYQDTVSLSPELLVATVSDYISGSYSAITLDGRVIQNRIAPIHADAFVRYFGGNSFYIVNSYKRDNVQIIDKATLKTVGQFALPALSNPHDLLMHENKLYAVLFDRNSIRIHNAATGSYLDEIDFSAHADTSDGLAEATSGLITDGMLYIALAKVDRNAGWTPLPTVLLRVDLQTRSIDSLPLPFTNPHHLFLDGNGDLMVPASGVFGIEDAGLLRIDTKTFSVKDTVLTEAGLGADLTGAIWVDGGFVLRASGFTADKVLHYDATGKNRREIASTSAYGFSGMTYDATGKTLYLGDAVKGLRLFSLPGFEEKPSSGISVGLPPRSLAIIR